MFTPSETAGRFALCATRGISPAAIKLHGPEIILVIIHIGFIDVLKLGTVGRTSLFRLPHCAVLCRRKRSCGIFKVTAVLPGAVAIFGSIELISGYFEIPNHLPDTQDIQILRQYEQISVFFTPHLDGQSDLSTALRPPRSDRKCQTCVVPAILRSGIMLKHRHQHPLSFRLGTQEPWRVLAGHSVLHCQREGSFAV